MDNIGDYNNNGQEDFKGLGFSGVDNLTSTTPDAATNKPLPNTIEFYFQQWQQSNHQNQTHQQSNLDPVRSSVEQTPDINDNVAANSNSNSTVNAAQAIKTAQAIAMRFHSQSATNSYPNVTSSTPITPSSNHIQPAIPTIITSDPNINRKHDLIQFQQSFQQRLQKAFLKNLEYIAKKDEEALQLQLQHLEQSKQYDSILERKTYLALQERQKLSQQNGNAKERTATLTTKAGIGTGIRKRQSKKERNQVYGHIEDQRRKNSVYVMGIQKKERKEQDIHNDIHRLFQSYGSIHKVKLYKNRETGKLKGDALVSYKDDINLSLVCSQLNGAELPCGSILNVQAANFDKKENTHSSQVGSQISSSSNSTPRPAEQNIERNLKKVKNNPLDSSAKKDEAKKQQLNDGSKDTAEMDADLDDFFDSLE